MIYNCHHSYKDRTREEKMYIMYMKVNAKFAFVKRKNNKKSRKVYQPVNVHT